MKSVLILGASGGIGRHLAEMFPGDTVWRHGCNNKKDCNVWADIADRYEVDAMVRQIGSVDILINCAAISTDGMAHKVSPGDWQHIIDVNLIGAFYVISAVLPSMRQRGYGRIINLSSVVYQRPVCGTSAYSASKAGLVGLTRTVAIENASKGITCNCIALGYFDVGMIYKIPAEVRETIRQTIPLQRFGNVDEIKRTVKWLIDTEYVTGQVINLNGGLYTG